MSTMRSPQGPAGVDRVAGVEQLAAHLTALSNAEVAAFLVARPDLTAPPAPSFTALAARAGARPSVETALADLATPTLAVAEAVVALGGADVPRVAEGLGLGEAEVRGHLAELARLALVTDAGPVTGLVDAFGPYPAGLGPEAAQVPSSLPSVLEGTERPGQEGVAPSSADLSTLSGSALSLLRALAWGPPVGTVRTGGRAAGASELLACGWLERDSDSAGRTRLILPREVALALRGGRLRREPLTAPGHDGLEVLEAHVVAAESARCAEEAVRLAEALLEEWGREGGAVLRSGGVGVRALARVAEALDLTAAQAATVVELAAGADLLGLDEAGATWVPARTAVGWRSVEPAHRWAPLAAAWAVSTRTPWLVGSRDDDGALRPVLGSDVEAGWAMSLRRRVLDLLVSLPEGTVVTPTWVRAALTWERPRRLVPEGAVSAVLAEAELLGVTGGGALSRAGRVLAGSIGLLNGGAQVCEDQRGVAGSQGQDPGALLDRLAEALEADLPQPVETLLVQSDLTAVVPGRPSPELASLLERSSAVESRGGALTVRFTPESVREALDAGLSAEELRAALTRFSPAPLPGALVVLIDDVARGHGAVRVREVRSVLRVPDPATAARLVSDARLSGLALSEVAPGVLVSLAPSGQVLRELRREGLSPVLEDASGALLLTSDALADRARGTVAPEPERPGSPLSLRRRHPGRRELVTLVGRLRAGEEARAASGTPAGAASDPVHALALLRQAQVSRSRLLLRLAGPDGTPQERRVRVLAVEPGRVRLADVVRETELTVAVHRIVSVEAV